MREAFSSLRARVLLLMAIPFAVMLGLTVYNTLGERQERLANARTHVLDTARVMAREQQRIVGHVHQVLSSLALLPEVRRGVASEECNRALAARHQQEPSLINVLLALASGDVICYSIPPATRISIGDRDFFQAAVQTRGFTEGGYILSRTTGKPGLGFALPLLDETGIPQTVVATTLSLDWLKQQLAQARLPEGARAVVVDGKGLVLGRYPDPEGWVGKSAAELPLMKRILANGGEGAEENIGLDGRRRIFGFVPLHRTATGQAYLWVAVPKAVVIGPAEHAFVVSLLVQLALLLLTFGVVWFGSESLFVRRIAALVRAAKELGKGNLAARVAAGVNGDEIGELAHSFDQMAERLQTGVTQLSRAVRALRVQSAGNRAMLHERENEQQLLEEMCRAIGEAGGYHLAWAGYAENDAEKSIRPIAHWGGAPKGYFENVKLTWSEAENAPPGRAIRTGRPVVAQNIPREPGPGPWRNYALRCGCGSCIALPLRIDGEVIGVLNICSKETDAFSDEEISLLGEAAADLSFGIGRLRAEAEQARVKASLKSAEARIATAAEASLDAQFILKSVRDTTGKIIDFEFTYINAHAEEMLGMVKEKVIGQKLCELLPVNRTDGFFDKYVQVVATDTPLEEEFSIGTPEIKAKWLRHQVVRVDDGIAISSRDITEWKEAGAVSRKLAQQNALILSSAGQGIYGLDGEGRITFINPAAVTMLGWSAKELIGKNSHAAFHHSKADGMPYPEEECPAHAAYRDGVAHCVTDEVLWKKDGTGFPVEYVSTPIRDEHGELKGAVVVFSDIAERKRAEQALRESEETLRTISSAARDAVLMLDNDGNIVFWNPAAEIMFGYSTQEAMGKELHGLLAPSRFHEAYRNGFSRFKGTGEGAAIGKTIELAALKKDGAEFPMELSLSAVKLNGKWCAVGIVRDVTEHKRGEEALRESRARLALALQSASMGAWHWDIVENRRHFDAEVCRLLGIDAAAFSGTAEEFVAAVHPDDRETLRSALARTVEQDAPYEPEYRAVWPDGSVHHIAARGRLVREDGGRPLRVTGILWDVTARKQAELALERANRALRTLSRCNETLIHAASESELLDTICRRIVEEGGYRMAWVGFAEHDPAKTLRVVAQFGVDEGYLASIDLTWSDAERGRGPTGTAVRTGATQVSQNILTNPNMAPWRDAALARGFQASIAVPLKVLSATIGSLSIYAGESDAFTADEVRLLEELAEDLGFGIATLRTRAERDYMVYEHLHHEELLRRSLEESIQAIAGTVEMRDPYTSGHQKRVAHLAVAIAKELGLPKDEAHGIQLAAGIHDLGKIRVPAEILSKPGKLSNVEFMLVQAHAQAGYDILKGIEFPWPIADIVLQHHERTDGSGYPQGLKGDQIELGARILAVADVIEAMASHRPYRPGLGIEAALAEIERGAGSVYDENIAEACVKLFREGGFAFPA